MWIPRTRTDSPCDLVAVRADVTPSLGDFPGPPAPQISQGARCQQAPGVGGQAYVSSYLRRSLPADTLRVVGGLFPRLPGSERPLASNPSPPARLISVGHVTPASHLARGSGHNTVSCAAEQTPQQLMEAPGTTRSSSGWSPAQAPAGSLCIAFPHGG